MENGPTLLPVLVRALTNSAGAVTDTYQYDAFGNQIAHSGSTPNVYLYRGERYDPDLGLYYLRARWYNPVTGRFMTRDPYEGSPYDPASLHRYNYARSNPANFIDPSGRDAAGEYGEIALNVLANAAAVTTLGFNVKCSIFAVASSVQLVGQTIGLNVHQLSTNFQSCNASITASEYFRAFATNATIGFGGLALGWAYEGIGGLLENAEPEIPPRVEPYGQMKGTLPEGYQANHLNQNAAYRSVIPPNKELANAMEGNAFTQPGTPHYDFHQSLENFWAPYRAGGDLFGSFPTNAEYLDALRSALEAGGLSPEAVESVAARAAQQQAEYGLLPNADVPNIPNPINQKPAP